MNPTKQIPAIIAFAMITSFVDAQDPQFTRIDTGTLVEEVVRGRGMYPVDIDQDGDLDLYIGNSTGLPLPGGGSGKYRPNLLYRNDRNCSFTKITDGILANKIYKTNPGNNWGDFDNDGDWDLFNHGEIFVNDGFGYTEKVIPINNKDEYCGTWIDYDGDSHLDIFTNVLLDQNYMYKNNGDGTFTNTQVGAPSTEGIGGSQSSAWADCDNDGDLDVFEANLCILNTCGDGLVNNNLYINEGDGTFSMISDDSPIVSDAMGAGGGSWGDYDNDGDMDLYVVSLMSSVNILYRNNGNLEFVRDTIEPREAYNKFTYGSTWGDFNNDGTLDLFVGVINGSVFGKRKPFRKNLLFMNQGDGSFTRITTGSVISDGAQALAANDIDNDGDLDLVITHGNLAPPFLTYIYRNDGNENHWLNFTCQGTTSNRSAIGTRLRVKAKIDGNDVWMTRELTQENGLHACNGPRLHFGLGNSISADSVIIRWPSGQSDTIVNVPADQFYHAIEGAGLDIDFRATNYIHLIKPFDNVSLNSNNDSIQLDLSEYFSLVTGDAVPEIEGDTLTFSIRSNENPEVVAVSYDPASANLSLKAGADEGSSRIQIITSAGFTKRSDYLEIHHENIVQIPDTAFLHALIEEGVDTNRDSLISMSEAAAVVNLFVSQKEISDLTGIEAFSNLSSFHCTNNDLTTLDVSKCTALTELYCGDNNLTILDISNNTALEILHCYYNQLSSLDVSKCTALTELYCGDNNLTILDISNNTALEILDCGYNQLSSLDVSKCTALTELICISNNLTSLDLSNNTALERFYCGNNLLTNLDLSNNSMLNDIYCDNNQLISLDLTNISGLGGLFCNNNNLIDLDLSDNISLEFLHCEYNQLVDLELTNNIGLKILWCSGNQLTDLDVSNNTALGSSVMMVMALNLKYMPTLHEVCVWETFPRKDIEPDTSGSPNVCFQTDCDGTCATGIQGIRPQGLFIYPNPIGDILNFVTEYPDHYLIEITSLKGQFLFSQELEGTTHQIDLSTFPKGVYFITIWSKDYVTTRKILKL